MALTVAAWLILKWRKSLKAAERALRSFLREFSLGWDYRLEHSALMKYSMRVPDVASNELA